MFSDGETQTMSQQSLEQNLPSVDMLIWTPAVWHALKILRKQYQCGRDLFSHQEHLHLCFLRWLVQTGRLVP